MGRTKLVIIAIFWLHFVFLFDDALGQGKNQNLQIIYGNNFIFTVEKPIGWRLDSSLLINPHQERHFYPTEVQGQKNRSEILAIGKDKEEDFRGFIKSELLSAISNNPDAKIDTVTSGSTGGPILSSIMLRYYDTPQNYMEEVFYIETSDAIIKLVFTAKTYKDYKNYHELYDNFISSFIYRGNKPKLMLEHLQRQ